ncbi:pectin lyase fold/virulence factor [Rhizoctonia solani]|nr:pectin lyase fold/virulence factor [Rhizoctonia solani]
MRFSLALATLPVALVTASPAGKRCTGNISSLNDIAAAEKCTTINISSFTVPLGKTFAISAPNGATINLLGDVKFGVANWGGPLFSMSGKDLDGKGAKTGVTKPHPMMWIQMSGTYSNVNNPAKLVVSKLTIDNYNKSGGQSAAHNTDGFDVATNDLTIEGSTIQNQDDCLAINRGSNIIFQRNSCTGGHGISIGSASTDSTVTNIQILNNKVINNDQALRIKTKADVTNASVRNIVYKGNTATGIRRFGVIVEQSYPSTLGTPGNNAGITFGANDIAVAQRVVVDCGSKCTGTWDWSGLTQRN